MYDETIMTDSPVGHRLEKITDRETVSYLVVDNKKVNLVAAITIGRASDNSVVIDNKLTSRHHAVIQKIKEAFFIKDSNSTNGTFVNGELIPRDKYIKLFKGDKITIGNTTLVIS